MTRTLKRLPMLIVFILLAARPAGAELWCGSGPGAPLDHPCVDDNSRFDRAFDEQGHQMAEWRKIPGVDSIGYGMSHRGFFPEIQIWVKDIRKVPSVSAKVPASVDGIAVAVVPPLHFTIGGPTDPTVKCPDQGQAYLQALKENMHAWQRIPGVFGAGPSKCDSKCCSYDRIGVSAPVPFLESVRAKIPREVHDIAVDVVPFRWPPAE
jgi:hypothetical protein